MNIKKKWIVLYFIGDIILTICLLFGVVNITYRMAYDKGIEDFSNTQVSKAVDSLVSNNSTDKLIRVSDEIVRFAVLKKESSNNTMLYDKLLSYFKELALSGELKELASGNNTIK